MAILLCSCNENLYLSETEVGLTELTAEYESLKYHEEKSAGEDSNKKEESMASKLEISTSMNDYITSLKNQANTAKQMVTRSLYSTTNKVVGVFKVNTCGKYKELRLSIDCEDSREKSKIEGNVGASFVDENGNVNLVFCLVDARPYYPGGVLLVDHITYAENLNDQGLHGMKALDVIVRHHDTEDNNPSHYVFSTDSRYKRKQDIKGFSKIETDVDLAWAFPEYGPEVSSRFIGAGDIKYGVLGKSLQTEKHVSGLIHFDDEDHHNKNWVKRFRLGSKEEVIKGGEEEILRKYAITANRNTIYGVILSTDDCFYKGNIYMGKYY